MSQAHAEIASQNAEPKKHHLDGVLADFRGGTPVEPDRYQIAVNDLCKALLALDIPQSATA